MEDIVRTICNRVSERIHFLASSKQDDYGELGYGECTKCEEPVFWVIKTTQEPSEKICRFCVVSEPDFDPDTVKITPGTALTLKKLGYSSDDLRRIGMHKVADQFDKFTGN